MNPFPIKNEIVEEYKKALGIDRLAYATIRQIVQIANKLEEHSGVKFIRTEMGVPGLPPSRIGVDAEIEALKKGVASVYPPIEGVKPLKDELSRFAKYFMNIGIPPECCVPTVGSMQSSIALFMTANRCTEGKDTVLFIDPGFPVHKRQVAVLGMKYESFDIYDYRGDKLKAKLESILAKGNISAFLYSNPNNPSWICFTEKELKIIGELATKYDAIALEDLAYFGMDCRTDVGKPAQPPYQATVAHYTDNYVLTFSGSKVFSYAGERIGAMMISERLFGRKYPNLSKLFTTDIFGQVILKEVIYTLSSGTAHAPQYALAAMLKAVNDGAYDFLSETREYVERAKEMKKAFVDNGFKIVYDKDEDKELADGFYFTVSYPRMTGEELLSKLLRFGVSAITLDTTGSTRTEGLRICVSQTSMQRMSELRERLEQFRNQ
ncbi:MAG: pyridoxal phosphate-dependent aminotransferase [Cytophagaceae bacterium]|jgi:aspartate/methionine/tyrosine aminotransferase|nr:pyridoxal phosphate-dependent aminotransferase [Cytophagaceae bacterium]